MRCAEVLAGGAVLAVAVGAVAGLTAGPAAAVVAVAVVLIGSLAALSFARNRFRSWAYTERDEDLIVERGVMIRRLSVVPYGRMQFVDVSAGPIDRIFRLATVKLHTAAAASDARIPGLEREEAARLRDRLAALGEARGSRLVSDSGYPKPPQVPGRTPHKAPQAPLRLSRPPRTSLPLCRLACLRHNQAKRPRGRP